MNSIDPLRDFLCHTPYLQYAHGFPASPEEFQIRVIPGTKDPIVHLYGQIHAFYSNRGWAVQLAPWSALDSTDFCIQIFHPTEGFQLRNITATTLADSMEQIIVTVGYIANPIEKEGIPFYIGEEIRTSYDRHTVLRITELGESSVRARFESVGYKYLFNGFEVFDTCQICENPGGSWDIMLHGHTVYVKIDFNSGYKTLELH